MKREPAVQASYDAFRRHILKEWPSVEHYIHATKFQGGAAVVFEPNLFPYKGLGSRHWILWSVRPLRRSSIEKLLQGFPPYRVQINKKSDQSVPGVWHAHILFDS
jgi:hypothetical protein